MPGKPAEPARPRWSAVRVRHQPGTPHPSGCGHTRSGALSPGPFGNPRRSVPGSVRSTSAGPPGTRGRFRRPVRRRGTQRPLRRGAAGPPPRDSHPERPQRQQRPGGTRRTSARIRHRQRDAAGPRCTQPDQQKRPLTALALVRGRSPRVAGQGFEPWKAEPAVLQTAPFGRSGNLPGVRGSAAATRE